PRPEIGHLDETDRCGHRMRRVYCRSTTRGERAQKLRSYYGGESVKWVGEGRPDDSRRGGFWLAARLAVLTVVAHDDGVRLKYAGWIPRDDVSDVNVTAVYRRASLSTSVESRCGS